MKGLASHEQNETSLISVENRSNAIKQHWETNNARALAKPALSYLGEQRLYLCLHMSVSFGRKSFEMQQIIYLFDFNAGRQGK